MAGTKRRISEVEDVETQPIPSVKNLASSESKLRRQALLEILAHFKTRSSSSPLTLVQCQQIWRGFHVAVYMHDSKNAISVQNLISTLADTFYTIRSKDKNIESTLNEHENGIESSPKPNGQSGNINQRTIDADDEDEFNGFDDGDDKESKEDQVEESWLSTYTLAFWTTIIREWAKIDSHRMNKYLLLIRLVTRALFTICIEPSHSTNINADTNNIQPKKDTPDHAKTSSSKRKSATKSKSATPASSSHNTNDNAASTNTIDESNKHQSRALLSSQAALWSLYPLNPRDTKIPNGLRIHILDIYVDELEKVMDSVSSDEAEAGTQKGVLDSADVLAILKRPLQRLARDAMDRNIRIKAKEEVKEFESRLESRL